MIHKTHHITTKTRDRVEGSEIPVRNPAELDIAPDLRHCSGCNPRKPGQAKTGALRMEKSGSIGMRIDDLASSFASGHKLTRR